jgi:phage portal protein BeeE
MSRLRTFFANLSQLARSDISSFSSSNLAGASFGSQLGSISGAMNVPGAATPAESTILAYACITARREAVGGAPMMVTDADGNPLESGPLVELLRRPALGVDWAQYVRQLETYLTLYNVAAILPVADGDRGPVEALELLHPAGLRAEYGIYEPAGTPRIVRWQYVDPTTGAQREFAEGTLIVHRGFNPHAPMAALSPVNVLRRTILADICAREQNLGLFQNDATPRGYLHSDGIMTKEQAEEVLSAWNSLQQGYLNRHKTAATWGGLKYDRLQLSPAELEFLDTLQRLRIDYYMAFRVYPAMLAEMTGETGLSQGSSTGEQRVAWWEDVGLPELDLIAGLHQGVIDRMAGAGQAASRRASRMERWTLSRSLLRRQTAAGRLTMWFNDSAIPALARNRTAKVDAAVKLATQLGYAPDEVSEYLNLGLPPHPDNLGRVPFALQPLRGEDAAASESAAPQAALDATSGVQDTALNGAQIASLIEILQNYAQGLLTSAGAVATIAAAFPALDAAQVAKIVAGVKPQAAAQALRSLDRIEQILSRAESAPRKEPGQEKFEQFIAPLEKAARDRWSRFFFEQRARVLKRFELAFQRTEVALREEVELSRIFPRGEEDAQLLARLTPLWTQQLEAGWNFLAEETGLPREEHPFTVDDPRIRSAIDARRVQGLIVNETTEADLKRILAEATEAGDTTAQYAERIAAYYRDNGVGADKVRPMTAARTQTAGIVNDGRLAAALEAGGLKKYWRHGGSAEPRPTHLDAARTYTAQAAIALDATFRVDGEEMKAPGDANASIGNTANCSCSLGFVRA